MDLSATLDAPCSPATLFGWVGDLSRYPEWLSIVTRVEPLSGAEPAWLVDLRGRLGPLARSKRLRMVRTEQVPDRLAVFERAEDDGRRHSSWVLRAEVRPGPTEDTSRLVMRLHYGGTFWGQVVERLLTDEIEASRLRLLGLVST